ncbi:hypothetical protein BN946_scf184978.g27 [Trametes cinnabarina]|uniref:MYND-type domain-containing protein n=1 Tax=Pycnoporus cinnabarinus TaxID=5643 RepID=A0A060SWF7_PYCCI|nr:hypothetical protein BN946_scf184978.g27 [Trametes cinnabarina]
MASPLFWPGVYYFYPIGNTSAVSLTRDIPPGVPADILLLPCGDPRNVLYTVFCEPSQLPRKLDFTCCDYDPGVLARDVLLLAMILDGVPQGAIWDIFLHIYLNDSSLSVLVDHCRSLIASADTLDHWHASSYGATIRMSSAYTLDQLRRIWKLYIETAMPGNRKRELRRVVDVRREAIGLQHKNGLMWSSARSAGPLFIQSGKTYSEHFHHYWETGTTSYTCEALPHANPTFLQSRRGEGFDVHYGTDPMVPFHLAPYFGNHATGTFSVPEMVAAARVQFRNGAKRFAQGHSPRQLTLLCCDAEYTDRQAPTLFDVIDTSNVSDHLGLLNILLATVPLMSSSSSWSGVLYTESLLAHRADATSQIMSILPAALSTLATLFDLIPVDALSGFTTICNTHELISNALTAQAQFHQSITWKRPRSCDAQALQLVDQHPFLDFSSEHLAALLFEVYDQLFAVDDVTRVYKLDINVVQRAALSPYARETFAVFLRFLRSRPFAWFPENRWHEVVALFLKRLQAASRQLLLDNIWHQDLLAQLYRHRVYTYPTFCETLQRPTSRLSQWSTLPTLVRIYLTVPPDKFAVLRSSNTAPTPPLVCAIRASGVFECGFQSVDAVFGDIVDAGTPEQPEIRVREAAGGINAMHSSVIVSFAVATWVLTEAASPNPDALYVDLCVKSTPATARAFMSTLGLRLAVFSAPLSDTKHVHIVPESPLPSYESQQPPADPEIEQDPTMGVQAFTRADLDAGKGSAVLSLTSRLDLRDPDSKAELANGAFPVVNQASPCTIRIRLGRHTQSLMYPLPVVGAQQKTRLARKSSYIEVVVPVAMPFPKKWAMQSNPFPVLHAPIQGKILPWNVHRVALDRLPVMENRSRSRLEGWLNPHIGSQLSQRERRLREQNNRTDVLVLLKDTIHCIMARYAGLQGRAPSRVFALRDEAAGQSDTIFFVDKLRYEVAAHTMVCDAFVLTLTRSLAPIICTRLETMMRRTGGLENVLVYGDELRAWKQLLPALVERCRSSWDHRSDCEYAQRERIPLETAINAGDPLCGCGRGKDAEAMRRETLWKPFAPYVTRIALSPLFAVSYLESVIDPGAASAKDDLERCNACSKKGVDLRRCSRCKRAVYCSQACQKTHWAVHKTACQSSVGGRP